MARVQEQRRGMDLQVSPATAQLLTIHLNCQGSLCWTGSVNRGRMNLGACLAVAQLPAPLQQVDVWQDATLFRQTGSPAPYSDDDEDSYPSEPEADRLCFYKSEHNDRPPPGAIKVRFTSLNRSGTKSVRVCERCLRWMRKPNAGVKFVLRGSSRGLDI